MKIQITEQLKLSQDENWKVQLHSFYNLIQVLFNELNILKRVLGESANISNALDHIEKLKTTLADPQESVTSLGNLNNFKSYLFKEIDSAVMGAGELDQTKLTYLEDSLVNLDKIVRIAEIRTEEFLRLISHKNEWVEFDTAVLEDKLRDVLMTMAMRSKGRYGITFDKSTQGPNDYYFLLDLSTENEEIKLPALFPDVIRDLTSNSKKYSTPGDSIICSLKSTKDTVSLTIKDNGRGIPEDEIEKIIHFGVRGSNVTEEETFGDGFGLTKAYLLTLEHKGKMCIDSVLGEYTNISIELPIPQ